MKTIAKILTMLIFLLPASLPAETFPEVDVEKLFAEKKAAIKDYIPLTEKQSKVFWPLYDDYEKEEINIFIRRTAHIREYMQEHKTLSDEKAKSMMKDFLQIEADALKLKRALVKKFSEILPPKTVFQFFVFQQLLEVGFFSHIAEQLPEIE
jgi:hypothetical protein